MQVPPFACKPLCRALLLALLPTLPALPALAGASEDRQASSLRRFVEATSLEALGEMVITEAKVPQSPDSVTQKIVVLRRDELEAMPTLNRNLADLVRYTSGQFVNVLSRTDANWGSYGGLGPKYNSYLLDGVPIDSFVDPMSLNPDAIERIELHKGPASVLYSNYLSMDFVGNQTPLTGTTNLVLRQRVEEALTRVGLGVGSYNTYQGRAYHQGRQGELSYMLGLAHEQSDYTQANYEFAPRPAIDSPNYAKTQTFGNFHYALNRPDHTVALFVQQTDHNGDQGRPNRDYHHRYNTANFAYNNQVNDDWHVQFKLGERQYDRRFTNDNYPTDLTLKNRETTRQTIRPMDLSFSYLHGQNSLLTFGADYQTVHYWTEVYTPAGGTRRDNDAEASSTGFFVQEKVQWEDWVFRAGVRNNTIEHRYALLGGNIPTTNSRRWNKTLWSLGLRYNLSSTLAAYGNIGSSFMPPAAKQIGGTVSTPGASGELANPGLKPESGVGSDLGLDWQATPALNFGVRAFQNTLQDAIVTNVVSVTPSQTRSENAGRVRAQGIEFNTRYAPDERFALFANLTRTYSRINNPANSAQDGSSMPFSPDLVFNAGLSTHLPGQITASPYLQWIGRYYDSAATNERKAFGQYAVVNLRLQMPLQAKTQLVLDLNNLTNRRYEMPFSFRDPGFNAFAGVNVSF